MFTSSRKQRIAWIALAALLYAAVSPVLAALRFQAQPDVLAGICTVGGIRSAVQGPAQPAGDTAQHVQHCLFCVGGAWQPPADEAPAVLLPPVPDAPTAARHEDVHPLASPSHPPQSPRAPPRA